MSNGKVGALTGKKAISLILLVVGIMLMFFIISQSINLFKVSKDGSDMDVKPSIKCVGYLYRVSNVIAGSEELQFEMENEKSSSEDIHNITVTGYDQHRQTFALDLPVGFTRGVNVPVKVVDNFTLYPDSCSIYAMTCSADGGCAGK